MFVLKFLKSYYLLYLKIYAESVQTLRQIRQLS